MIFPKKINLFNRNLLSFRQKKVDEATHEKYQSCKEKENAIAKMTHCSQKALSDESCEEEVYTDNDALAGGSCF